MCVWVCECHTLKVSLPCSWNRQDTFSWLALCHSFCPRKRSLWALIAVKYNQELTFYHFYAISFLQRCLKRYILVSGLIWKLNEVQKVRNSAFADGLTTVKWMSPEQRRCQCFIHTELHIILNWWKTESFGPSFLVVCPWTWSKTLTACCRDIKCIWRSRRTYGSFTFSAWSLWQSAKVYVV